jgi:predicted nucleic acid-binding protein
MLIDSNIIIYAALPEHSALRQFVADHVPFVSSISYIEVLGYHRLNDKDRQHFQDFFAAANVLPVSNNVIDEAVKLRQQKKMSLGDSLIAGTALTHNLALVTRNVSDFEWITALSLINPFDSMPPVV